MHRLKLSSILFWFLAAVSAALLVALALIVGGVIPIDPASQPPGAPPDAVEQRRIDDRVSGDRPDRGTRDHPGRDHPHRYRGDGRRPVGRSRGDSWFAARVGSESGRLLDERVLTQGAIRGDGGAGDG